MRRYSKRIESNLRACWDASNADDRRDGMDWYARAHRECVSLAGDTMIEDHTACGVVAALSPGKDWAHNLSEAREAITAFVAGEEVPLVGAYGRRNVAKAVSILQGFEPLDVLKGPKVRAFYDNLYNPEGTQVCLDRHAKAAALGVVLPEPGWQPAKDLKITNVIKPGEYEWLAWHFRVAADYVGVRPNQFQAVCWVLWRRLRQGRKAGERLLKAA